MENSAWSSGLTYVTVTAIGFGTGNPVAGAIGAIQLAEWLFQRWQEADREQSPAKQPSATLHEQINTVSRFDRRSGWFQKQATKRAPTRESDEAIVRRRAEEIARSNRAGTNFDNWIRAVIELKIEQRAAEIARSPNAGSDLENWLRAERELKVAQRAKEIAGPKARASTYYEIWPQAEYKVDVAERASEIAHSRAAGSDEENWDRAERELDAERAAIRQRAEQIANSSQTAIEIRTHAEIMLRAEEIAASPGAGTDWENWLQAERELAAGWRPERTEQEHRAYQARLNERVRRIAASPEAALGHWLRAEQQLRAEGRIAAR